MKADDTRATGPPAEVSTDGVRISASRLSKWFGPAVLMLFGLAVLVVAVLMLNDAVEPATRFRSDAGQLLAFGSGIVVFGLGVLLAVRARSGKTGLVVMDQGRMWVNTLRGVVEIDLDRVEYITTIKSHGVRSLAVGDADGNTHHPILRPENSDWDEVATRLNEKLRAHRGKPTAP